MVKRKRKKLLRKNLMGIRSKGKGKTVTINDNVFVDIQMKKVGTPNSANSKNKIKDNAPSKD